MRPGLRASGPPHRVLTDFLWLSPCSAAPARCHNGAVVPTAFRRDAVVLLGGLAAIAVATESAAATSRTSAPRPWRSSCCSSSWAPPRSRGCASPSSRRIASTLAFNFFFLQPVGTFAVADPQNWVVLAVYLTVAVVASQFSASAQDRARTHLAETLLASLSHDMRTPLTSVRVAVENLRRPLDDDAREAQAAAAATELERLTLLVENMLDMAQIDAGALRVDRQWVAPADVVDAAVAHVRQALERPPDRGGGGR